MVHLLLGHAQQGGLCLWNEPRQGEEPGMSQAVSGCLAALSSTVTPLLHLQRTEQAAAPQADGVSGWMYKALAERTGSGWLRA